MVAKYCDEYVCLWVCLSVCLSVHEDISGTTHAIFTKFSVHVACVHCLVLLWHAEKGFFPHWKCIIGWERGMGVHSVGKVCHLWLPCFCLATMFLTTMLLSLEPDSSAWQQHRSSLPAIHLLLTVSLRKKTKLVSYFKFKFYSCYNRTLPVWRALMSSPFLMAVFWWAWVS